MFRRLVYISMCVAGLLAAQVQPAVRRFSTLYHLQNDAVILKRTREPLTFLATWVAPELAQLELVQLPENKTFIRNIDGDNVKKYPEKMALRVTISNRTMLQDQKPLELETELSAEELAKSVHFRMRIYDGLEYRVIEPIATRMIGVPRDLPYNERIYMVEFNLKDVPLERRLMIEVLDPRDQRVARFSVSLL